jgi:hypothetical protein
LTDEVQEALSTMEHEEFDATAEAEQGLKRRDPLRHHPKRQCGLRMCLVIYTFLYHVYNSVLVRRIFNGSLEGLR